MNPFTLSASYKDYLWGGERLKRFWGKKTDLKVIAESWELSAHPAGDGLILDGSYKGLSLSSLVSLKPEIVSNGFQSGGIFPILVKFIDAKHPLSIQVHPCDEYAVREEHCLGKSEMWYILDSDPGAYIYLGFNREVTKKELEHSIEDGSLTDLLCRVEVRCGDCFFIPAGTVHSIGGGILLAEVQQNSDRTYRLYDYGRMGQDGKQRPLHVRKALDVATLKPACRVIPGASMPLHFNGGILQCLAACPYFRAELLSLSGCWQRNADGSSFYSLLCLEGDGVLSSKDSALRASKGTSLFVPAVAGMFKLEGKGEFLISSIR